MKHSSPRSRRHRNKPEPEKKKNPFFAKTNDTTVQSKAENTFFQAKLNIGQPGDQYEKEADSVADSVVNKSNNTPGVQQMNEQGIQRVTLASPQEDEKLATAEQRMEKDKLLQEKPEEGSIQRMEGQEEEEAVQMQEGQEEEEAVQMQEGQEEEEAVQMQEGQEEEEAVQMQEGQEEEEAVQMQEGQEEEEAVQMQEGQEEEEAVQMQEGQEEEEALQTKSTSSNAPAAKASNQISSKIQQRKGKGKGLPEQTRAEMENSFGVDFSGVTIHTDPEAIQMNKKLGAQAFTTGKDIYFNSGKFRPETNAGKHLLAHELTHVIQQTGGEEKLDSEEVQKKGATTKPTSKPTTPAFNEQQMLQKARRSSTIRKLEAIVKKMGYKCIFSTSVSHSYTDTGKKLIYIRKNVSLDQGIIHYAHELQNAANTKYFKKVEKNALKGKYSNANDFATDIINKEVKSIITRYKVAMKLGIKIHPVLSRWLKERKTNAISQTELLRRFRMLIERGATIKQLPIRQYYIKQFKALMVKKSKKSNNSKKPKKWTGFIRWLMLRWP